MELSICVAAVLPGLWLYVGLSGRAKMVWHPLLMTC